MFSAVVCGARSLGRVVLRLSERSLETLSWGRSANRERSAAGNLASRETLLAPLTYVSILLRHNCGRVRPRDLRDQIHQTRSARRTRSNSRFSALSANSALN